MAKRKVPIKKIKDGLKANDSGSKITKEARAALASGVPGLNPPAAKIKNLAPPPILQKPLTVSLKHPDGSTAANVPVTLYGKNGSVIGLLTTNNKGVLNIPKGNQIPASFRVGSGGAPGTRSESFPITESDITGGVVTISVSLPGNQVTFFGQVVYPNGEPAGGIGLSIQRSDNVTLALTVSDPNGAWFLSVILNSPDAFPDASPGPFSYQIFTTGNSQGFALPDLQTTKPNLYGPLNIVMDKTPANLASISPASALLSVDTDTAELAMQLAPHLFLRGASAISTSPCSPYLPRDAAAETFFFTRIGVFPIPNSTLTGTFSETSAVDFTNIPATSPQPGLRYGVRFTLRQDWRSMGLVLGELLHSIPLAPCEQINIASVDWQSRQYGARTSALQESDYQDTTLSRDRNISEAVRMSSEKHTNDSGGGGEASFSIGPFSLGGGGYASSTDSLMTAAANSIQSLHDKITMSSSVLRDTRGTTVTTVAESETSTVTTRTIRNNNHCHTVTYQFFSVLQRYLVETRVAHVEPVVLVPFVPLDFTQTTNTDNSSVTTDTVSVVSSDQQLLGGLFSIPTTSTSDTVIKINTTTVTLSIDKIIQNLYVLRRALLDPSLQPVLDLIIEGTPFATAETTINSTGSTTNKTINIKNQQNLLPDVQRLIDHLNANKLYYTVQIIRNGDPLLRWSILSNLHDDNGYWLSDIISSTEILGAVGGYIAFGLSGSQFIPTDYTSSFSSENWLDPLYYAPVEDPAHFVTLPTSGSYAEAQLGHCNACETKDDSVFWDWKQSPCGDNAPDITAAELASRFQGMKDILEFVKSDLTPTQIPIPNEPGPISIGDKTLQELAKSLPSDSKDVLSFLDKLAALAQKSTAPKSTTPASTSAGSGGSAAGTPTSAGSGAADTGASGAGGASGAAGALGDYPLPASDGVALA